MITDLLIKYFRKDPTIKRHLVKTVSWRIVGSIDTALLGYFITGKLSIGLKIGGMELLTKMLLYFIHERVWHKISFGLPFKYRITKPNTKNTNLFKQTYAVNKQAREQLNKHAAFTIWFTGLSGSGKSTLASSLDEWFYQHNIRSYIIDGDNTRLGINNDLDFSREGRQENIRRVAEICRLFNEAGIIVISSFISPFEEDRQQAKNIIGEENFTEVFIDASLQTCTTRDKKGLYKLALEGKVKNFTGVSSPYEKPEKPDLHINTNNDSIEHSTYSIIEWVQKNKLASFYANSTGIKKNLFQ